jgi:hypothetical protein
MKEIQQVMLLSNTFLPLIGRYNLIANDVEFYEYLTKYLGFKVIKMTQQDQARYGKK